METVSWFSLMNVVLVAAGIGIGVAAGLFASPAVGEAKRLRAELDRLLKEHETYKGSVNAHFRKTADLVGQMTKSYAAVYDHLAGGARSFCDDAGADTKIPFAPLPGELASPVIETAQDEPVATDWPTDIVMDDIVSEDAADRDDDDETSTASLDSKAETTPPS